MTNEFSHCGTQQIIAMSVSPLKQQPSGLIYLDSHQVKLLFSFDIYINISSTF